MMGLPTVSIQISVHIVIMPGDVNLTSATPLHNNNLYLAPHF